MTSTKTQSAWDFTPVFELIQSLKSQNGPNDGSHPISALEATNGEHKSKDYATHGLDAAGLQGLGDFNRVWDYLGVKRDAPVPTPSVPHFEVSKAANAPNADAYASDGPLYYPPSSKSVKWRDDEGHDLTDIQELAKEEQGLNKNQRKKRNRKLRKAAETQKGGSRKPASDTSGSPVESENSPPFKPKTPLATPKSKKQDTEQTPMSDPQNRYNLRSKQTKETQPQPPLGDHAQPFAPDFMNKLKSESTQARPNAVTSQSSSVVPAATRSIIDEARQKVADALKSPLASKKAPLNPAQTNSTSPTKASGEHPKKHWPVANPYAALQAQPQTPPNKASSARAAQTEPPMVKTNAVIQPPTHVIPSANSRRHEILPLINQTSIDRNWSLFLKVLNNFPEDRRYLVSPLQLSYNRPTPHGIHVFVDASNIMIGFMEHLKRSRGIPQYARVPRVDLNFHALALLLERRRPVAKRVVAGSTPEVPAFEEARQVGYETCIMDKVYKAKELTERQKFFEGYSSGGNGSANVPPPQQPKWVEQGVDEILHLKICESVIDTPIPAEQADAGKTAEAALRPTMVLATGDAAEAEYSPGFLKMVERALKYGWKVEVMAFGKSVSMGYRRMEKTPMDRGGWGERFKIIELDAYAEELFGEAI